MAHDWTYVGKISSRFFAWWVGWTGGTPYETPRGMPAFMKKLAPLDLSRHGWFVGTRETVFRWRPMTNAGKVAYGFRRVAYTAPEDVMRRCVIVTRRRHLHVVRPPRHSAMRDHRRWYILVQKQWFRRK